MRTKANKQAASLRAKISQLRKALKKNPQMEPIVGRRLHELERQLEEIE